MNVFSHKFLKYFKSIFLSAILLLIVTLPILAQSDDTLSPLSRDSSTAGFLLLLPMGVLLLLAATLPNAEKSAPSATAAALTAWGVAIFAFFAVGFAFAFGGVAVTNAHPDFAALQWNWSPWGAAFGTGWGFIGLKGWALLGAAATPAVYDLFLRHLSLLGIVAIVPVFALYRRNLAGWVSPAFGVLVGGLLYPLSINWVWSRGFLANLGLNLGLGNGFVDAGVATPFALAGIATLAALLIFKSDSDSSAEKTGDDFVETPLPKAYLPLLTFLGLAMILWAWAFAANGQHIPTPIAPAIPRAALNGFLGAFSALTALALYSKFATTRFDNLLIARGGLSGLILVSAVAPFIVPWQAILLGLIAGGILPFALYFFDQKLALQDHTAAIAVMGVMGILGWLMVGIFADGTAGIGWNGVDGVAVSGLFAGGVAVQLNAQLIGAGVLTVWAFLLAWLFFYIVRRTMKSELKQADGVDVDAPIEGQGDGA